MTVVTVKVRRYTVHQTEIALDLADTKIAGEMAAAVVQKVIELSPEVKMEWVAVGTLYQAAPAEDAEVELTPAQIRRALA